MDTSIARCSRKPWTKNEYLISAALRLSICSFKSFTHIERWRHWTSRRPRPWSVLCLSVEDFHHYGSLDDYLVVFTELTYQGLHHSWNLSVIAGAVNPMSPPTWVFLACSHHVSSLWMTFFACSWSEITLPFLLGCRIWLAFLLSKMCRLSAKCLRLTRRHFVLRLQKTCVSQGFVESSSKIVKSWKTLKVLRIVGDVLKSTSGGSKTRP